MLEMKDLIEFGKLLEALGPWQGRVVIVGGWAHRLYRFHPESNPPEYIPVTTKDADVALSLNQPLGDDIGSALKANGFRADLRGDVTPPVTHYRLGDEDGGFYAEFLVPLIGGRVGRDKKTVPLTVQMAGVSAQKLRHLEILLIEPWSVELDPSTGTGKNKNVQVAIPNPVTFVAQKLLIKSKREPDRQAQDSLYVHDTVDLFANKLDVLNKLWIEQVRPKMAPKTAATVESEAQEQFSQVNDIHRSAVRIPLDRRIDPEDFQRACAYGLARIFKGREPS
jgi:hypothetical protein